MKKNRVLSGIDRIREADRILSGCRVGLMTNPTGIDHNLRSTIDIIHERYHLSALYAVEHGIRGDQQAGARIDTCTDSRTGVTVFSAFGSGARFNPEMLDAFDTLVFDIQDVGARFYTYLYSLAYAMEACAAAGKRVVVLDRINPLGGERLCGTVIDPAFDSFVGDYELPTRYALTIGEFARYVRDYLKLDLDLTVVPLEGWKRGWYLDDTDLPWVSPSPNCPNLESALCYIGTCIFEGTNVSEGRGTTIPFQIIGAPWIDGFELEEAMNALNLPGLRFRSASFCPTFSKHAGQICRGVQVHVTDRGCCDLFAGGLYLLDTIRKLCPDSFEFLQWEGSFSLDRLLGTDSYRTGALTAGELIRFYQTPVQAFAEHTTKYHLYD